MGLFGQRAIQKKIAPVVVEVGPWVSQACEQLPFLSEAQVMFLAGLHVTASAQSVLAGCTTSTLSEGRHHAAERILGKRDSILRFEGFGTYGQLTLGTPGSVLDWKTDWVLQYSFGGPTSQITVPTYGTWNDEIANVERMDKIRALLADTIARGPQLVVTSARPDPAEYLMTIRRDREFSPMSHDYCDQPDATRLQPIRLPCAPSAITAVATSRGYTVSTDPATGDPLIHLAPSADPRLGTVRISAVEGGGCELMFNSLMSAPIDGQRVRRRGLRLLNNLAVDLGNDHPAAAVLNAVVAATAEAANDPSRWIEAWTDQTLSPQWMLTPGSIVPVAIAMTSTGQGPRLSRMIEAASSVALRRRTFTRGLTRKTRDDGRLFFARNAAILTGSDGSHQPYVRYVTTPDTREATIAVAGSDYPPFWEVFQADRVTDTTTTCILSLTGLGATDGNVAYGDELMAYLDAYCAAIARHDPHTTFQTIGLRVPSG